MIIYSKNDVKHVFPPVVLKATKPRFKCPTRKTMAFPDSAVPNSNCTPRNIELEIYSERVLGGSSLDVGVLLRKLTHQLRDRWLEIYHYLQEFF